MNFEVIEANRRVHSSLILSGEYQRSPHRKSENVKKIQTTLANILPVKKDIDHLDIGCGDGFIFECAPKLWRSHGVDATPEMLDACSKNHPNIQLKEGLAENLPYPNEVFDIVTCYSFLDHLESTEHFYAEAFRVLKPGGVFYFGLNPNREFFLSLLKVKNSNQTEFCQAHIDLKIELEKAFDDGTYYHENFGINKNDLTLCEPGKSNLLGLSPEQECEKLLAAGMKSTKFDYQWIIQQNHLEQDVVNTLINFLPFTRSCFKYFNLTGSK